MKSVFVLLLGIMWFQTAWASPNTPNNHSKYAGVYQSRQSIDAKTGPSMNVSLGKDGTATVTEDAGNGATTSFGHWQDLGAQVRITFDSTGSSMVLHPAHDGLQAASWAQASGAAKEPPPMKKGYKVKQLYWTTTGP